MTDWTLGGIYKICNLITGDSYIRGTKNLKYRFCQHRNLLGRGKHPNKGWKLYEEEV